MAGRIWDWGRFGRLLLLALGCTTLVVAGIILRPWVNVFVGPYKTSRTAIALLIGLEIAYGVVLVASLIGVMVLGGLVYRARRRGMRRPGVARRYCCAALCLLAFAFAESGAAAWRASIPPVRFIFAERPAVDPGASPSCRRNSPSPAAIRR